jgi:hypothetical protein
MMWVEEWERLAKGFRGLGDLQQWEIMISARRRSARCCAGMLLDFPLSVRRLAPPTRVVEGILRFRQTLFGRSTTIRFVNQFMIEDL